MYTIPSKRMDGRRKRGERTARRLVEAYISLATEKRRSPTAEEVASEAGCSSRSVFERFNTLGELELAVFDVMLAQHAWEPDLDALKFDREGRSALYLAKRATVCEKWLPLWRTLMRSFGAGEAIDMRIATARERTQEDLRRAFGPELALLEESECHTMLRIMDALFDFECWGRMRELEKLPVAQARRTWRLTLDWMLDARAQ
jgi:AcrR family transcriptional regulator